MIMYNISIKINLFLQTFYNFFNLENKKVNYCPIVESKDKISLNFCKRELHNVLNMSRKQTSKF